MKLPQTGGCQCGKIRYEITEAPQLVYTCHCTDRQRLTSSAFSLGLVVAETAFHRSGSEPRPLQRTADSGRTNTRLVCLECGSWICGMRGTAWSACVPARSTTPLGCDRPGISGPAANSPGLRSRRAMRFSRYQIRAAVDRYLEKFIIGPAIAHAGLRSTVRGSSTSSSITSLGNGVAVIKVTPSEE
jgi:hypothetical protein